ncbi:LacI family DNA-binding transcriptional regulator [Shouchella miscanthi]|uniref:LacI family DNA-binding transcriptional regulator n=1 Tax=Shouchella miscanthi TaxID=2598861 RepID=A0ABU6NK36_9BACI|nr:LacI family DNA-binding transcriptional regulator [Shouchella miscanthi]
MSTIKDVAKLAGVAPSTVSRVIADSPKISKRTKERVKEIMDELGYYPNVHARNLVNKETNVIGVIMPSASYAPFQNPFFPEVLRGITAQANKDKYGLYLSTGQTEEGIMEEVKEMVYSRRVDGIILLYSTTSDPVIPFLLREKFPFVVIGRPPEDYKDVVSYVNNDNVKAAKMLTEYVLLLKHERIGFIGGRKDAYVTLDHKHGYEQALETAGIEVNPMYFVYHDEVFEGGEQAVIELMAQATPPTALVVADDLMALGVLRMLTSMGYRVPEDISVVSFNNVLMSELSAPPLTTMDIFIYELGFQAATLVRKQIAAPPLAAQARIVGHKLVRRSSTSRRIIKESTP